MTVCQRQHITIFILDSMISSTELKEEKQFSTEPVAEQGSIQMCKKEILDSQLQTASICQYSKNQDKYQEQYRALHLKNPFGITNAC